MTTVFGKVRAETTVRLVPHIPFIISYMRHSDARAAEMFSGAVRNVDDEEVQNVYRNLLEALDMYGDLTSLQLRTLCADYEPPVWARAVLRLFMGADPRIVPQKVSVGLFAAISRVRDPRNGADVAVRLGAELDKLRLVNREALGEFCALIRDTSNNPVQMADFLGPAIFLDERFVESDKVVASLLMRSMVEHAELVFGKSGARSQFDPLGVRRADYEDMNNFDAESTFSGRSGNRRAKPPPKKEMASALSEAGFL